MPIHLKQYPIPHSLLLRAKETVEKHIRAGTLTPSSSSLRAMATFFFPKPNGELRMLTDFQQLNKIMIMIRHPHPQNKRLSFNMYVTQV
jgi:hypothetical protein